VLSRSIVLALCVPVLLRAQEDVALRVRVDSGAHEMLLELGPFDLPAHSGHHGLNASPPPRSAVMPFDAWLHGYTIELVDSTGRRLPGSLIHHVNIIAPQRRELFSNIMLRIGAAGTETAPLRLPRLLGYRASSGDTVLVSSMLHNESMTDYRGVTLRVRVPYTRSAWVEPFTIYPFYLDVMPPAGTHSYDLPPGRSERYWEGKPAIAGRMLGVSGHLHKYGVELRLEDRTANRVIWSGKPSVDSVGNVAAMPLKKFLWTLGEPLDPSHVYRLTAIYDNPTGRTIPDGGMGALGGVMVPRGLARWPLVTRGDPEYLLDLRVTYRVDQTP